MPITATECPEDIWALQRGDEEEGKGIHGCINNWYFNYSTFYLKTGPASLAHYCLAQIHAAHHSSVHPVRVSANSCSSCKWREWCLNSISYLLQLLKSLHISCTLRSQHGEETGDSPRNRLHPATDCTQQLTLLPACCSPLTLTCPATDQLQTFNI